MQVMRCIGFRSVKLLTHKTHQHFLSKLCTHVMGGQKKISFSCDLNLPILIQCSFYYAFPRLLSLYWGEKTRTRYDPESR